MLKAAFSGCLIVDRNRLYSLWSQLLLLGYRTWANTKYMFHHNDSDCDDTSMEMEC